MKSICAGRLSRMTDVKSDMKGLSETPTRLDTWYILGRTTAIAPILKAGNIRSSAGGEIGVKRKHHRKMHGLSGIDPAYALPRG